MSKRGIPHLDGSKLAIGVDRDTTSIGISLLNNQPFHDRHPVLASLSVIGLLGSLALGATYSKEILAMFDKYRIDIASVLRAEASEKAHANMTADRKQ